ncbi:hypothetical protein [Methylorubrum extorquens]|uniref:hypothetical protein n=1 Tax=Methylorubrum extorquens TaxID=408 RepID=UPI000158FCEC|nr:hypothetical protein [Methylorubrum extorquens]ABY31590.1 hypothetical protein Mext_3203 [Methylorubrum extorquens PA1]WIU38217.1 hypothetical protein KQ926_16600 [Methylorubrum extorquens]
MTEKPLATYRPVFVLWMALLQQVPLQLFFTLWAAGFFAGMYHEAFGASTTLANSLAAIGSVVFIGFPVVVVISRAMNYRTTRYRLYPDRIEIDEGFLTIHAKRLMFRDYARRRCGVGCSSAASGWAPSVSTHELPGLSNPGASSTHWA